MKSSITAVLFSALVATASVPPPADACGVKLTVKSSAHRKGVARTTNPSDVLLLGSPPRRLSRDLSSAGHRVEVAPTPEAAKRKSYAVVVADNQQAQHAREKYPGAVVLVRSGDVVADMRTVEKQVARKPVKADEGRAVVAAEVERPPIAAGPIQPERKIVTAAEPKEPEEVKATPPPAAVEAKPKPPEKQPEVVASQPVDPPTKPTVTPKTVQKSGQEVYFGLNSASSNAGSLDGVVKWLNASPDVQIVVEGHSDPTGNADDNMLLSEKRAEWVRDALVSAGIDASRIEVKAFGETKLRYGTKDRKNRRAMIVAK